MGIYCFTNVHGRKAWGIITELFDHGAYVLFDEFSPKGKTTNSAHYAYVSFEPNPFVVETNTTSEVLPVTTPVRWQDARVAAVAQHLGEGFAAWWSEFGPDIRRDMYSSYK